MNQNETSFNWYCELEENFKSLVCKFYQNATTVNSKPNNTIETTSELNSYQQYSSVIPQTQPYYYSNHNNSHYLPNNMYQQVPITPSSSDYVDELGENLALINLKTSQQKVEYHVFFHFFFESLFWFNFNR